MFPLHPTLSFDLGSYLLLLPNDIGTPFTAHPNLMHLSSIDIDSRPNTKGLLGWILVLGVGDGELAPEDEMCGQPAMRVRSVMCVSFLVVREPGYIFMLDSVLFMGQAVSLSRCFKGGKKKAYGASVQVKTVSNPHERTSFSASF